MKKLGQRALIILSILFVLLIGFLVEEHFRGEIELNSRLKQLLAQGAKLDYRDLVPLKGSPDQNAAPEISLLTNELRNITWPTNTPPAMKLGPPGYAQVPWRQKYWTVDHRTNGWDALLPKIHESSAVLQRLQNIWPKKECDENFDYSKGFADMSMQPLLAFHKKACLVLSGAVSADLLEGNNAACLDHLHSMLAITRYQQDQPLMISQLVRIACARIAFATTWQTLQTNAWTGEQLAQLQSWWQDNEFASKMVKAVEMERAMSLQTYRRLRESRATTVRFIDQNEKMSKLLGKVPEDDDHSLTYYFHRLFWRFSWSAQEELQNQNQWELLVEGLRLSATNSWLATSNSFGGFRPRENTSSWPAQDISWFDEWRFLSPWDNVSGSAVFAGLKSLEVETEKNMAVTAIALRRYELRHGKPAMKLADLIPEFLSALPLDRMNGKPLEFRDPGGSFRLYSVGMDGIDDGGEPVPIHPVDNLNNIWTGRRDAVWPIPSLENDAL